MYLNLNADNVEQLKQWYGVDATFVDPFHSVSGIDAIVHYFAAMYENVESIHFDYKWQMSNDDGTVIGWVMTFTHKKINGGKPVSVDGVSHIRIEQGKVIYHRDFFDGASMLYEQLPVLGSMIRFLKKRMAA
nr:nuclear transport factor 2 family protein [Echinimonas agarilytica]